MNTNMLKAVEYVQFIKNIPDKFLKFDSLKTENRELLSSLSHRISSLQTPALQSIITSENLRLDSLEKKISDMRQRYDFMRNLSSDTPNILNDLKDIKLGDSNLGSMPVVKIGAVGIMVAIAGSILKTGNTVEKLLEEQTRILNEVENNLSQFESGTITAEQLAELKTQKQYVHKSLNMTAVLLGAGAIFGSYYWINHSADGKKLRNKIKGYLND